MRITRRKIFQSACIPALALLSGNARSAPHHPSPTQTKMDFPVVGRRLQEPAVRQSANGVLDTRLRVMRAHNFVGGRALPLGRTYEGGLTGPTLRVKPGDSLRIQLFNDLSKTEAQCHHDNPHHCQDHTNLHTHGMHVSPSGAADNVLIDIPPGESFQYQIDIPKDHYPGIAWYHPHRHGTVAKQVMEGMSGALIVAGGLDEVPEIRAARDQVMVLQQLVIPGHMLHNLLPITLNGQLWPALEAMPGELLRWRFVHASTIDFIELELRGPGGRPEPLYVIAEDGMALGRMDIKMSHFLNPGNRVEILVRPEKPGQYELVKKAQSAGLRDIPDAGQVLARLTVSGPKRMMPLPDHTSLAGLMPFAPITDAELTGRQPDLTFEGTSGAVAIDGKPFSPGRVDRTMHVGDVEEWNLRSITGSHPFHIHVNPFQVVKINGKPVDKPMWRDVVLVRKEWEQGVTIRTRYQRFTGLTVLHCHNLVHEDKGMMQLIELLPPR